MSSIHRSIYSCRLVGRERGRASIDHPCSPCLSRYKFLSNKQWTGKDGEFIIKMIIQNHRVSSDQLSFLGKNLETSWGGALQYNVITVTLIRHGRDQAGPNCVCLCAHVKNCVLDTPIPRTRRSPPAPRTQGDTRQEEQQRNKKQFLSCW